MLYINGIPRPYLEKQRKNGMKLNEELNKCRINKCNQNPINKFNIDKAKNNNKSTIPISIYNNSQCVINKCNSLLIKVLTTELNNYVLFLKYNNKLNETKLKEIKNIKKLLFKGFYQKKT